MLKKILSYLFPISVEKFKSEQHELIEVFLYNGKYIVNTQNTNYSYGSLQKVLAFGMTKIDAEYWNSINEVLLLGVAGGSVVETMYNEYNFKGKITAVDYDSTFDLLLKKYFTHIYKSNFQLIIDDAFQFIKQTNKKYDFVIIDLFNDDSMPNEIFQDDFFSNLRNILNANGILLFNLMLFGTDRLEKIKLFENYFSKDFDLQHFKKVEQYNDVLLIRRK